MFKSKWLLLVALAALLSARPSFSQQGTSTTAETQRSAEIRELREQLKSISARLDALESQGAGPTASSSAAVQPATSTAGTTANGSTTPAPSSPVSASNNPLPAAQPQPEATPAQTEEAKADAATLAFFRGTTLNFGVDGYYDYNFNSPIGRVNLLRAYDVTSNSFNINQASIIVEKIPTPQQRAGGRIDLQFGQATETLQGSNVNEQRPQVWRNLYQAYGSWLAPIGSGLQLDFGKFASSLGSEGNYTKDQVTYSRSYSFNYLPFYHMGLRANYTVSPKLGVGYWLVNGANDTEDTNGFKSQAFLLTLKPASSVTWNVNYYFGQESRDVQPTLYPGFPALPTQPGLPTVNITPAPSGREHIFDTYATWNATHKLALTGEADYVLNRTYPEQQPPRVVIGSLLAKYALPNQWSLGGRFEYFDDRGGLFSGKTQALKEATFSVDHLIAPGFIARAEYRRDFSNQRFFLTDTPGVLVHAQTTATLGLIYWWGMKQGAW